MCFGREYKYGLDPGYGIKVDVTNHELWSDNVMAWGVMTLCTGALSQLLQASHTTLLYLVVIADVI